MKTNFYCLSIIFFLTVFFVAPAFALGADNNYNPIKSATQSAAVSGEANQFNGVNLEKIFYLASNREEQAVEAIHKNHEKIDILAPQAYAIGYDMQLHGSLSDNLREVIGEYNMKVMPLVVNAKFSQTLIHDFLLSDSAQKDVIKGLIEVAKKDNYIGWQFDIEHIYYKDRDLYSSFVEKAAEEFHKNNLILSIAAVCRVVDYENTAAYKDWGGAFDYKRIAQAVDFISMMTYDDSNSVGPTASVAYINQVLEYVKDKIPKEKLSMGIPFYYWGWSQSPYKRISSGPYSLVEYTAQNFQCKQGFDDNFGVPWLTYSVYGKAYKIWYEDKQSFEIKLDIAKSNNLRGFSAWVLGSEDPAIWSALN